MAWSIDRLTVGARNTRRQGRLHRVAGTRPEPAERIGPRGELQIIAQLTTTP